MSKIVGMVLAGMLAAATGVSPALAGTESGRLLTSGSGAKLWNGTVFVTSATSYCNASGKDLTGRLRAFYRPRLKGSDPKAAVIVQTDDLSQLIVIRAVGNTATLQGTGEYCGINFDAAQGESTIWLGGTATLNVTPLPVTANTNEVKITGTVRKFLNIPGCIITFRAAFERQP